MTYEVMLQGTYGLTQMYQQELSEEVLFIWYEVLKDLTEEEYRNALTLFLRSNEEFFPKPGQIYQLARPKSDPKIEASLIADLIFAAVRKHGWDTVGIERAKREIGEIGWKYIKNCGGWETFVQSIISEDQVSTLKAQARMSLQGLIDKQNYDNELAQLKNLKTLTDYNVSINMIE
jgi:hypothetical protein